MAEYYNVTTNQGDVEVANAITNGTKINITHIAFGDGNGSVPTPTKSRTTLVREVHRQAVTKYERHATNPNWIVIETIIPSNVGGFTIREMGIIGNGKLISHGSHAPYEKVADLSGVSEYRLKFTQNVTDVNVVSMTLDDSLIYATQAWIDENYVPRDEIIDNLTTDEASKPVSAKQAKKLNEEKVAFSDIINSLDSNSIDKPVSAMQAKKLNNEKISFTDIVDNLTTDNSNKPVSAKQAKLLQDNKLDANKRGAASGVASLDENKKVPVLELPGATDTTAGIIKLINDLTTGGADAAITAEQIKLFFLMFTGGTNHFRIPNPSAPSKPWIIQWDQIVQADNGGTINYTWTFPFAFPNECKIAFGAVGNFLNSSPAAGISTEGWTKNSATGFTIGSTNNRTYRLLAIGN